MTDTCVSISGISYAYGPKLALSQVSFTRSYKVRSHKRHFKFRGCKKLPGDYVEKGMVLFTQLGLKVYPGANVCIYNALYIKLQSLRWLRVYIHDG